MPLVFKVIISGIIISFASWLSLKKPSLAGFIIALPLVSILSIIFSYLEHKDLDKTLLFAKSILIGIPASLLFFLPFFFGKNLGLSFFSIYALGIIFLIIGYFLHRFVTNFL